MTAARAPMGPPPQEPGIDAPTEPDDRELAAAAAAVLALGVDLDVAQVERRAKASAIELSVEAAEPFRAYLADVAQTYRREQLPRSRSHMFAAAAAGDTDLLISSVLLLVVDVALDALAGHQQPYARLMDLIGEGNLATVRAARRYDWRRGFAFSTYAMYAITHAIARENLQQDASYGTLSAFGLEQVRTIQRQQRALSDELGRPLGIAETLLLLQQRGVRAPQRLAHGRWPTLDEVEELLQLKEPSGLARALVYLSEPAEVIGVSYGHQDQTHGHQQRTVADVVPAPALRLPDADGAEPMRDLDQLTVDLRWLVAHSRLRSAQADLLVLRSGARHYRRTFVQPAWWQPGCEASIRLLARHFGCHRNTVFYRLHVAIDRLSRQRTAAARRTLATLRAPAPAHTILAQSVHTAGPPAIGSPP